MIDVTRKEYLRCLFLHDIKLAYVLNNAQEDIEDGLAEEQQIVLLVR